MKEEILLGDEAVALGAVHAGLSGAYSYPGTPASEIMEYLIRSSEGGKNMLRLGRSMKKWLLRKLSECRLQENGPLSP